MGSEINEAVSNLDFDESGEPIKLVQNDFEYAQYDVAGSGGPSGRTVGGTTGSGGVRNAAAANIITTTYFRLSLRNLASINPILASKLSTTGN